MPVADTAATPGAGPRRLHLTPATALVGAGLLAGTVVRVVLLRSSIGSLDSDEAVVGLMARRMAAGHFWAFFWGQAYGGTLEPLLSAVVFKVFGPSTTALKTVPLTLDALATALVWRIGRRVTSPATAAMAALLVWVWPANYLWWSIKARGFYEVTFCLGLGVVLVALRIGQDRGGGRWTDWALLGLLGGLGFWQSPQIAYALVPVAGWLVLVKRAQAWRAVAAVVPFFYGMLPWLVANVRSHLASLTPPPAAVPGGYLDHLGVLLRDGLPMTLGLKLIYGSGWLPPVPMTAVLYPLALVAVVIGCARAWPGGRLVVGLAVAFPFLHALLSLSSTVAEGRYTLFLLPWLVLAAAHAVGDRRLASAGLVAACVAVSAAGLIGLQGRTLPYVSRTQVPASFAPLERALAAEGHTRVWAPYWVAYRVTFETREHVLAAPVTNGRYPPFDAAVRQAPTPAAHVFLVGTSQDGVFAAGLAARGIGYRREVVAGRWAVYLPDQALGPDAIPGTTP